MYLTEWARLVGVHPQTMYRWFQEGWLPVLAVRVEFHEGFLRLQDYLLAWARFAEWCSARGQTAH